ncbi:polysaccharide biosynthesis/export family protein [Pontimicrobium aquaticum]|uniref:Sugar transporter n=1 Tax=Pontimicrobium aquaticum TaxID=2565367 RepID=A0A4U0EMS3_9FLAO|nr:polysaccharide biosynthesis/export family protein [Pontimicrobium aquaticum]TJY32886.1 sugar transporter [Pontimicrobium aquaticum]
MKKIYAICALVLSVLASSCVSRKDTLYFQDKGNTTDSSHLISEVQKPYRIQINDQLNIRVKALDQELVQMFNPVGDANLNAGSAERAYFDGFTVDLHGNIKIPTLGNISVLGYTTEEIEKIIEKKLLEEQFKETANIFVTVKLSGLRFTVNGEVVNPGTVTLFQERVNIYEAIANVGEIPTTGDKKDVMIIRQYPQGQQIHHLDLTDVNVMKSPYYYIQPNDIIYVKPIKQKSWGTGTTGVQSLTTIVSVLSLVTTTILLISRN